VPHGVEGRQARQVERYCDRGRGRHRGHRRRTDEPGGFVADCRSESLRRGVFAHGKVAASDAYFPFADGVATLAKAGITAIIQPGGSIRDQEAVDAADQANVAMMFTGRRHFRHV